MWINYTTVLVSADATITTMAQYVGKMGLHTPLPARPGAMENKYHLEEPVMGGATAEINKKRSVGLMVSPTSRDVTLSARIS